MFTRRMPGLRFALICGLTLALAGSSRAQSGKEAGDWLVYGADNANSKYSPLDKINKDNVDKLKVAWTWTSPAVEIQRSNVGLRSFAFENTPLKVGDRLYASSSLSQVSAIDAATGQTIWTFDPEVYKGARPTNFGYLHRGVAYWSDGGEERIYIAAHDARLYALNAKTGKLVESFGEGGKVNLAAAIPRARNAQNYTMTSPPVICRDKIIVGSSVSDVPQSKEAPRGDIQAFDVKTGKPAWIFHVVPQEGEFGNETWLEDSWKYTGNANAWSVLTADEQLGYVYCPTGTPTNDWYGGQRLGDNLFAESLVCLDAATGKRVWHFQTVHHGLWDYDIASAPVLCDIKVDGRDIKAVAQVCKTGFCWVFDRATGKPVWPIEERPVPQTTVPGEKTAPTQPFPTKPAPFERQGSTEENLVDFTPEIKAEALEILNKFDHGPIYTPPTERGAVNLPGWMGGANWLGAAFDPDTSLFYVPSITSPTFVRLSKPDAARSNMAYIRGMGGNVSGMAGASVGEGPRGLPLFKPPYGRVTAIDLKSGDHAWMVPNGDGQRKRYSDIAGHDVGPVGSGGTGPLLTKTLLFIGQGTSGRGARSGGGANVLRAFDKTTGATVAELPLDATPSGTPMTYLQVGKQHIVVATEDGKLVCFTQP